MLAYVSLSLVHVEELDRRALAIITLCCPHLKKLNLCNCEFDDREDEQEINLAGRVTGNTCSFTRFFNTNGVNSSKQAESACNSERK